MGRSTLVKEKFGIYSIINSQNVEELSEFLVTLSEADSVSVVSHEASKKVLFHMKNLLGSRLRIIEDLNISPFRFDTMRNFALAALPEDLSMAISLDSDEYLESGWRLTLSESLKSIKNKIYKIEYEYFDSQFPNTEIRRTHSSRIHSRFGYHYFGATHEYLVKLEPNREEGSISTTLKMYHKGSQESFHFKKFRYMEMMENDFFQLYEIGAKTQFRYYRQKLWCGTFNDGDKNEVEKIISELETKKLKESRDQILDEYVFMILKYLNSLNTIESRSEAQLYLNKLRNKNLYRKRSSTI